MKYAVKLIFKYSDTVHVEADNKEDAISMAMKSDLSTSSSLMEAPCNVEGTLNGGE